MVPMGSKFGSTFYPGRISKTASGGDVTIGLHHFADALDCSLFLSYPSFPITEAWYDTILLSCTI